MASISGTTAAVMALMAIASAASTAMSISAQNQQADAQADAATKAAAADYTQQVTQQEQIDAQAAQEKLQRAQAAMVERARLRVSSGEAGIGGLSPAKDIAESFMKEGMDLSTIETNRLNKVKQVEAEKNSTYATAQGRINTANAGKSSGWTSGLQIGLSGLQGGAQGYTLGKAIK